MRLGEWARPGQLTLYLRTPARHCSLVAPPTRTPASAVSRPNPNLARLTRPKLVSDPLSPSSSDNIPSPSIF